MNADAPSALASHLDALLVFGFFGKRSAAEWPRAVESTPTMTPLLLLVLFGAHPELETKVLLSGADGGVRLAWLKATRGTQVQVDQSQAVLLIHLTGQLSLPGGERPRAISGPAGRCEAGLHFDFGAEVLMLQAAAGTEDPVGQSLKQKCPQDARQLARDESRLDERFDVGSIGTVQLLSQSPLASAGELTLNPNARVAAHQHDTSTEVLYVLGGGGRLTVGEQESVLTAGSALSIPGATRHSFIAGPKGLRAVQFYLPPGPEERFRPKPPPPPPAADRSCKVDADCYWSTRILTGPLVCCGTCEATAGNRAWLKVVEQTCAQVHTDRWPCLPLGCGPVERHERCVRGQCQVGSL